MKKMLKKSEVLKEGYIKGLKKAQSIIKEMMEQTAPVNPSDVLKKCIDYLYDSEEAREMNRNRLIDTIYNNFVEDMVETYHKTPEEAEEAFADVEDEMYDDTRVKMFGVLLDTDERYTMKCLDNWLDANFANWDSFEQTEEGTLLNGDYFIFVDVVGKWLYAQETYLNEWSSCYKIQYYDEIPNELYDKASDYLNELDNR